MFERFGLDEQAKMKKDMEERAEAFWQMPLAIEEKARQKFDGAVAIVREIEIEALTEIGAAFSQNQPPDPEARLNMQAKTSDNPLARRSRMR